MSILYKNKKFDTSLEKINDVFTIVKLYQKFIFSLSTSVKFMKIVKIKIPICFIQE